MHLLAGLAIMVMAADAPDPETCLLKKGQVAVASADHAGKTYRFPTIACRDLFLSDPERYSQLFDALTELNEKGKLEDPRDNASLVPS